MCIRQFRHSGVLKSCVTAAVGALITAILVVTQLSQKQISPQLNRIQQLKMLYWGKDHIQVDIFTFVLDVKEIK